MGKINYISKCRKKQECNKCGKLIPVGSSYYKGTLYHARPIVRCTKCGLKSYEVTTSAYVRTIGKIVEDWQEDFSVNETSIDEIVAVLSEVLDTCTDNFENIPEQLQENNAGSLLQERIDELQETIDELEGYGEWNEFLSKGYDNLDPEDQEVIDAEIIRRDNANYDDVYSDFSKIDSDIATRWKEQVEEEFVSFVDETLGYLSY